MIEGAIVVGDLLRPDVTGRPGGADRQTLAGLPVDVVGIGGFESVKTGEQAVARGGYPPGAFGIETTRGRRRQPEYSSG